MNIFPSLDLIAAPTLNFEYGLYVFFNAEFAASISSVLSGEDKQCDLISPVPGK